MATSTFSGPVRSENTFKTVSKDATTGTITELTTLGDAPVTLADGDVTITNATHSGRLLAVPDGGQDNTYTLPSPVAGAVFRFIYSGGAADATDFIIDTGSDTNYFIGGVTHLDSDAGSGGDEVVPVYSDGNSNSKFQANVPGGCDVMVFAKDSTNWYISGWVTSATAPTFADQ
jgi:hypothetical protein